MLEASLFLKLGCFMVRVKKNQRLSASSSLIHVSAIHLFQIIQTFFVSAISGSVSAQITNMLSQPTQIIDLLAHSLPAQVNESEV